MVRVGRDVEHVFDPVSAIGNLHVDPARFVILHSTVPVNMEAEDVFVEAVLCIAIVDDKARVNEAATDQGRRQGPYDAPFVREKYNPMILWIANLHYVVS